MAQRVYSNRVRVQIWRSGILAIDFIAFAANGDYPVGIDKGNGELTRLNMLDNIEHLAALSTQFPAARHVNNYFSAVDKNDLIESVDIQKKDSLNVYSNLGNADFTTRVFGVDDTDQLAEFDLTTGEAVSITGMKWGINETRMVHPFVENEELYAFASDRQLLAKIDADTGEVIQTGPNNYGLTENIVNRETNSAVSIHGVYNLSDVWYVHAITGSSHAHYSIDLTTLSLTHIGTYVARSNTTSYREQSIVVVSGTAYTVAGNPARIHTFDPTTVTATVISSTSNFNSVRWLFVYNNKLYGFYISATASYLVEINTTNGTYSQVGSATQFGITETDLRFPFVVNNEVFALAYTNHQLAKLNVTTGVAELIGVYKWHQNRNDIQFPIEVA